MDSSSEEKETRFDVQITDICAFDLPVMDRTGSSDPYLKLDFDNYKLFKTDVENKSLNPSWAFSKRFIYKTKYINKLKNKKFIIRCYDHNILGNDDYIGECYIDLYTLCTGPKIYNLTLLNENNMSIGRLHIVCIMKELMYINLYMKDISIYIQGSYAPSSLNIQISYNDNNMIIPFSKDGYWNSVYKFIYETSLIDMLNIDELQYIYIQILDNISSLQGICKLYFRDFIDIYNNNKDIDIQITIQKQHVGDLKMNIKYTNLPKYSQMIGGVGLDRGVVNGGHLLLEGLEYPPGCIGTPSPISQISDNNRVTDISSTTIPTLVNQSTTSSPVVITNDSSYPSLSSDIDIMEDIPMPPNWEVRKDARTGRPYYADHRSKKTCWVDPRFLPENWGQRIDPQSGRIYYAYHKTKQTTFVDPRGLDVDWEQRLGVDGNIYYAYHPTKSTTYLDPRGLPEDISAMLDAQGRLYFKNHKTRTTQWEDPRVSQSTEVKQSWLENQRRVWWQKQKEAFFIQEQKDLADAVERRGAE
eukprot:GHVL01044047.1.p1 GENE.GHVL01044047.1~~GHVL01044047.1.p1  ORF type:complete len:528 (+),score=155.03 GHVL01044047.1:116-1699(+)